jgi:hypothetical protein
MPKVKISEFDIDPANNTDINSINIAEGCAPSGINNAIRQLMSDLKEFQTGAGGDPFNGAINGTVGATTPSTGAFTTLSATGVATVSAGSVSAPAITTSGDTNTGIFFPAADTIAFAEGGAEAMRIDSSGNVGIGTSSISVPSGFSRFVAIGDSDTGIGQISDGILAFATNNTEKVRIDANGNFLVGTTSPSYSVAGRGLIELNGSSESLIAFKIGGSTTNAVYQYNQASSFETNVTGARPCCWTVNGSERMRIDSSGKLLVGGTSTSAGYSGFNQALIGASPMLKFQGTTNAWDLYNNGGASFVFAYNASDKASINQSTGAYTALSDINKKKDFEDSSLGLNAVMQLQPKLFRMIDDSVEVPKQLGFIAQEVKNIIPQAYVEQEGGNGTFIGLNFNPIVAVLTKAIQEQQAIITDLKSRITALESK